MRQQNADILHNIVCKFAILNLQFWCESVTNRQFLLKSSAFFCSLFFLSFSFIFFFFVTKIKSTKEMWVTEKLFL